MMQDYNNSSTPNPTTATTNADSNYALQPSSSSSSLSPPELPADENAFVMGGAAFPNIPGVTSIPSDSNTQQEVTTDGTISSMLQSHNNNNLVTYSDPGAISPTSPHRQSSSQNNNEHSNNTMIQSNITISANDIKKELEEGDYIGQTDYLNNKNRTKNLVNDNAISAFIKKTINVIESSQTNRTAAMESQIIEQHCDNIRRYKGYPSSSSSSQIDNNINGQQYNQLSSKSTFHPEPCTGGRFLVTKLRSWRTGYERILSLHKSYFTTLDPETNEITNLWKYTQVKQYLPLQNKEDDCILFDVMDENGKSSTKLKLKCRTNCRHEVLIAFVKCKYMNDLNIVSGNGDIHDAGGGNHNNYRLQKQLQDQNPLFECQRQTRHNTRIRTLLLCAPYGLVEIDSQSRSIPIQTYSYKNIRSICFIGDEGTGLVIYTGGVNSTPLNSSAILTNINNNTKIKIDPSIDGETICDEKVFFITSSIRSGGSGRSDLVTVLKLKFDALGLPLQLSESVRLEKLIQNKLNKAHFAGGCIGMFPVMKVSQRRECIRKAKQQQQQQPNDGTVEPYERYLVLTQNGFILECEDDQNDANSADLIVISCRKLREIASLIRHSQHTITQNDVPKLNVIDSIFSIEFKDGLCRTYSSSKRDAIITSILDPTVNLCRNYNATVTDISTLGYSFTSLESPRMGGSENNSNDAGIFQSDPVEVVCLRRVQNVALTTNFYMDICLSPQNDKTVSDDDCIAVIEACREFNMNVTISGIRNLPADQNVIMVTIKHLWGIVSKLLTLRHNQSYVDVKEKLINCDVSLKKTEPALSAIFQTLYRLMLTPHGYAITIDDEVAMNVFSTMMSMISGLPLYWSLKCASALLLPRPFSTDRDLEMESKNKTTLLRRMPDLVTVLIENTQSTLIRMVVSNMLESVLCSHHESTDSDDFSYIVGRLAEGYSKLMQLLYSEASVIVENTGLFLYILQMHSPKVASMVKDVALNSGMLLHHFYHAMFNILDCQRFLSRFLCTLWFIGSSDSLEKQLLARMVPSGFFSYLSMPILSDEEEKQLDEIQTGFAHENDWKCQRGATSYGAGTNVARLRERIKISTKRSKSKDANENFRIFFHVLEECHSIPDLIWNQETRKELKCALEKELNAIKEATDRIGGIHKIAWNHQQFKVPYPSLERKVKVGTVYLQLWLDSGDSFIKSWSNPLRLFELLFRRFLYELDRDHCVTNMCILCIERLYIVHSSKIGPFPDIMFLMRSMMETSNNETQHRLLHLIASLVGGISENKDNNHSVSVQNAEQLLNIESFEILCKFITLGHVSTESIGKVGDLDTPPTPSSKTLHNMWFYVEGDGQPTRDNIRGPFSLLQIKEHYLHGQISPHSLLRTSDPHDNILSKDGVSDDFLNRNWKKLNDIWQLRWSLVLANSSPGIYSHVELSSIALNCLSRIISAHQSVDSRGIAYIPIPVGKRLLCEHSLSTLNVPFISIISQMLLSGHSTLITSATSIISKATDHNDMACAKLYLTGIFYFAFTNFEDEVFEQVLTLIRQSHLRQDCCTVMGGCSNVKELSILADILPHGLYNVLVNTDVKNFAQVYSSNLNTPEVIWNPTMKKYLQHTISQHLGDFPLRLHENIMERYKFCPLPRVTYEALQGDIYCHRYYLNNLCDDEFFSDWPIVDPTEVFRECLKKWSEIVESKHDGKIEELLEESRQLLGLEPSFNDEDLRQAYCDLAKIYCYEKMEMFEKIKNAYEQLSLSLENPRRSNSVKLRKNDVPLSKEDAVGLEINSTVKMQSVYLLLKTQLLICKRYSSALIHLKYPAYALLFSCLKFNPKTSTGNPQHVSIIDQYFVRENRLEFTRTVVDLIFNTCLVSPSNAEELVICDGLIYLEHQLDFYIEALTSSAVEDESNEHCHRFNLIAEIIIHIVHTIAGVAFFDFGRAAILSLEHSHRLCTNWRKCLDFNFHRQPLGVNVLRRYILEGIASMSKHERLQSLLIGSHIVWLLIKSMLAYDPLIETTPMISEAFESSISKSENNYHAFLATRALGMLCGVMKDDFATPPNGVLFNAMRRVLTQPIAKMLSNSQSNELLMTLNLNIESPLRLWDEKMRSELACFVQKMEDLHRHEECQEVNDVLSATKNFEYSNLSNEVNIGGVYIRIFNRMDARDAFQNLPDGPAFVNSLLEFVGRSMHNSPISCFTYEQENFTTEDSVASENHWFSVTDNRFIMAVLSIRQLVKLDGVVDDIMCTSTGIMVLFGLVRLPKPNEAHDLGHEILQLMSSKKFFADAVGHQSGVIRSLISTILSHQQNSDIETNEMANIDHTKWLKQKWLILESLAKSPAVAGALVKSSAWLELLGVVSSYDKFSSTAVGRIGAARTLARILWDPVTTGIAGTLLQKFLPQSLILIMKERGAEVFLESFDNDSENPELIWNSSMRRVLKNCLSEHLDLIITNTTSVLEDFSLDSMFSLQYERLQSEIYVGGVFVKNFLQEPTFNLRDPSGFLENLMIRWTQAIDSILEDKESTNSDSNLVYQQLTEACKVLCKHSYLCVKLSPWGYMKRAVMYLHALIEHNLVECPLKCTIDFLHFSSSERVNIESIIDVCDTNGRNGIVDGIMKAIRANNLHSESGFMLETLKIIIKDALGTVKEDADGFPSVQYLNEFGSSPAPGKESVKNMKKVDGGDPLSMLLCDGSSEQMGSNQITPNLIQGRNQTKNSLQTRNLLKSKQKHLQNQKFGEQVRSQDKSMGQPKRNMSYPTHHGLPTRLPPSRESSQYKHPIPTGRGVKPVRNQINVQTSNNLGDPLNQHLGTTTKQSPLNSRSDAQMHNISSHPKPFYQTNMNTNNNMYPSTIDSNGMHQIANQQLFQNHQHLHYQSSNIAEPQNNQMGISPQLHYTHNMTGNNYSQPRQSVYETHPLPPIQAAHTANTTQQHLNRPQNTLSTPLALPTQGNVSEPNIEEPAVDPYKVAEEKIKTSCGATGCAKGRNALLSSILSCGLVDFLVKEVLVDSALSSASDPDNLKQQAKEIINLLTMDPGYGLKFQLILKELNYDMKS